jgi:amino acid transporter
MKTRRGVTPLSDASLDSGGQDDATYLRSLGYKQELRRSLGLFSTFAVQFSLIGVSLSIFLLFGYGLTTGGPRLIIPFIVGGGLQMIVGLSVAELISAYPLAGGAYQIVNRSGSRTLGWQVGWWQIIALLSAIAAEGVGVAEYVGPWLGMKNPSHMQTLGIAFAFIIIITLINMAGIRAVAFTNGAGILAELTGLSVVVVLLLIKGLAQPLGFLSNSAGTGTGWGYFVPFLFIMLMPAFMISSFDSTGHTGEETKNAAISAPKGVVIANFGAYVYAIIALIVLLLSITNLKLTMASGTPITAVVTNRINGHVSTAFTAIVVVSFLVNMEILQLTAGRIIWAQARDNLMPAASWLHKVGERSKVPVRTTVIAGVIAALMCIYSSVLSVLAAITAVAFAACYGVVILVGLYAKRRGTLPNHPWKYGKFGVPLDVIAALWSAALCGILIYQNPKQVGLGFAGLVVAGVIIYYITIRTRDRAFAGPVADAAAVRASTGGAETTTER